MAPSTRASTRPGLSPSPNSPLLQPGNSLEHIPPLRPIQPLHSTRLTQSTVATSGAAPAGAHGRKRRRTSKATAKGPKSTASTSTPRPCPHTQPQAPARSKIQRSSTVEAWRTSLPSQFEFDPAPAHSAPPSPTPTGSPSCSPTPPPVRAPGVSRDAYDAYREYRAARREIRDVWFATTGQGSLSARWMSQLAVAWATLEANRPPGPRVVRRGGEVLIEWRCESEDDDEWEKEMEEDPW